MLKKLAMFCCCIGSLALAVPEGTIDDTELMKSAMQGLGLDGYKSLSGKEIKERAAAVRGKSLNLPVPKISDSLDIMKSRRSVGLVVAGRQCPKCPLFHPSSTATAWVANADGVLVTNYHVLAGAKEGDRFGVAFDDGSVYGIEEILASDESRDIAVFRINAKNLRPLAVGPDTTVGSALHLISHPEGHFYTYSEGKLARYTLGAKPKGEKKPVVWMISTAEFALGSSGGPMMDDKGRVAGMVASTSTLYGTPRPNGMFKGAKTNLAEKEKALVRDPQMVIRQCVAACSLRDILYGESK